MRQFFPVEDLARDERFVQTNMAERMKDGRTAIDVKESSAKSRGSAKRLTPERHDASDDARGLMHGIMVEAGGITGAASIGTGNISSTEGGT